MANVVDLSSARTGTAFPNTESGSRSKGFLKFLAWPFSIVFAMRSNASAKPRKLPKISVAIAGAMPSTGRSASAPTRIEVFRRASAPACFRTNENAPPGDGTAERVGDRNRRAGGERGQCSRDEALLCIGVANQLGVGDCKLAEHCAVASQCDADGHGRSRAACWRAPAAGEHRKKFAQRVCRRRPRRARICDRAQRIESRAAARLNMSLGRRTDRRLRRW